MDYTFSYLIGASVLATVWLLLFTWRKDVRNEMLVMSLLFGIAALIAEPIYIQDWWRPLTVFGTAVGFEDFLFGASVGGIAAVAYEVLFKKNVKPRKVSKVKRAKGTYLLVGALTLSAALFFGLFFSGISSFTASGIALVASIISIWAYRRDLIVDSLMSGFLLAFFELWAFWVVEVVTPGWVDTFWFHENLMGIIVLTAPIEDVIWGFLAGAFIGPLYEFWKEEKLVSIKKIKFAGGRFAR